MTPALHQFLRNNLPKKFNGLGSLRGIGLLSLSASLAIAGCQVPQETALTPSSSAEVATTELETETAEPQENPEDGAIATSSDSSTTETDQVFFSEDGLAIRGADPVAYFEQGEYVPGTADLTHDWMGVTWQFSSAENLALFQENPEQYAPQYGGFCAWAVSEGYTAPVDPNAWRIVDGQLYLNYDRRIQERWERDIPGHISQANLNWPRLLEEGIE